MKNLILICAIFLAGATAKAQAWSGKGDQKIQVGFNSYGFGTGLTGTYDYGLSNLLSVGGGANAYFSGYKDNDSTKNFFVFGRLNAHLQKPLNLPSNWDIYAGLDLGILGNTFEPGAHIGARYFFNKNVGIYLEAGSSGSIGVSFNL